MQRQGAYLVYILYTDPAQEWRTGLEGTTCGDFYDGSKKGKRVTAFN